MADLWRKFWGRVLRSLGFRVCWSCEQHRLKRYELTDDQLDKLLDELTHTDIAWVVSVQFYKCPRCDREPDQVRFFEEDDRYGIVRRRFGDSGSIGRGV